MKAKTMNDENHWGIKPHEYDDDYLMHYGVPGMKWKNHVYATPYEYERQRSANRYAENFRKKWKGESAKGRRKSAVLRKRIANPYLGETEAQRTRRYAKNLKKSMSTKGHRSLDAIERDLDNPNNNITIHTLSPADRNWYIQQKSLDAAGSVAGGIEAVGSATSIAPRAVRRGNARTAKRIDAAQTALDVYDAATGTYENIKRSAKRRR